VAGGALAVDRSAAVEFGLFVRIGTLTTHIPLQMIMQC
jgi:hypothetical protein